MSEPFKLFRLQSIDTQLDQARARLRDIEAAKTNHAELQAAEQAEQQANAQLMIARKALRHMEENVQAQRIKIEQTEAALYGGKVRNPKELQDLQNESAALKRYQAVLEDRLLEAMIVNEDAEAGQAMVVKHLGDVRNRFANLVEQLTKEQAELIHEVARQEGERQAAASGILESELQLYEQLRQQRRGLAVAKVVDRTCSACGSTLSAALLHTARSLNQIARCDSCGRILYAS